MDNIITYDAACNLVMYDDDISTEFSNWLSSIGKKAWEWDDADLGEFFRDLGYITIYWE